jgi:hypothetical protein
LTRVTVRIVMRPQRLQHSATPRCPGRPYDHVEIRKNWRPVDSVANGANGEAMKRTTLAALAFMMLMPLAVAAQWVDGPTPGVPRLPNGKADLSAPAPRTTDGKPDLSGVWRASSATSRYVLRLASDLPEIPLRPEGRALYDKRLAADGAGRPAERCLPHGLPLDMMFRGSPIRIVQTPSLVVMLLEIANHFRQIPTYQRELNQDFQPTWYGYSTGKWDGDEFVIDTTGFNDDTWLDNRGLPHSDALHLTERFKRVNVGRMNLTLTVDDPKLYTKPWNVALSYDLMADSDLYEDMCDNNKWVARPPIK